MPRCLEDTYASRGEATEAQEASVDHRRDTRPHHVTLHLVRTHPLGQPSAPRRRALRRASRGATAARYPWAAPRAPRGSRHLAPAIAQGPRGSWTRGAVGAVGAEQAAPVPSPCRRPRRRSPRSRRATPSVSSGRPSCRPSCRPPHAALRPP
eukprot:scaffold9456_cov59-Phaeocystis_antarctica.AAC.6